MNKPEFCSISSSRALCPCFNGHTVLSEQSSPMFFFSFYLFAFVVIFISYSGGGFGESLNMRAARQSRDGHCK